jgi:hypothetical protein
MDRDPHKSFPPNAAGNVGSGSRNFTVGYHKRRAARRLASAAFRHNGHVPKPVIGRLGQCRNSRKRASGDEGGTTKYGANAIVAHESNPRIGVMTRLIREQCVQNLLRRGNAKSSLFIKHLTRRLVPGLERLFVIFGGWAG